MDDKKKTLVVGALFVAMLAIGAFQFTRGGGGGDAPVTEKKKKDTLATKAGEPAGGAKAIGLDGKPIDDKNAKPKVLLPQLSERDPFHPVNLPPPDPSQAARNSKPAPPSNPSPTPGFRPLPGGNKPAPIQGFIGGPSTGGPLPPGAGPAIAPPAPGAGYHLKGIITGAHPVAVFADEQGNERLVPQGSSLDGDTKVEKVSKNGVTVRARGKTKTFTPGGNDSEN